MNKKIVLYSAEKYDCEIGKKVFSKNPDLEVIFERNTINEKTVKLAKGCFAIIVFVNDHVDKKLITKLANYGVKLICCRSAGFNNVDIEAAQQNSILVARVPSYSPQSVAEHALTLLQGVNRHLVAANKKVTSGDFTLEGLMGFCLEEKTIGVVGTGKIGKLFAKIMGKGFNSRILCYDKYPDKKWAEENGYKYVSMDHIAAESDVISAHLPLLPETSFLFNASFFEKTKHCPIFINTSRGQLVKTVDLLEAIENNQLSGAGLDVYENEQSYFFHDCRDINLKKEDNLFWKLLNHPKILLTAHQSFFTKEAVTSIYQTTLENIQNWESAKTDPNFLN